jgi:hypothetical protein
MDERAQARQYWLEKNLKSFEPPTLLAGDASFRLYFRLQSEGKRYVLMDAPPTKEPCDAFIAIDRTFQSLGLQVPNIYYADPHQGFLLLSDFGDHRLLNRLNEQTADFYYQKACENLLTIQRCHTIKDYTLPKFNDDLYRYEWNLFCEWYLQRHLGLELSNADQRILDNIYHRLVESALSQPQVCVHRDYHSRNLMVLSDERLGILDFQDAVWGPITYDVISLFRDCYIEWPEEQVKQWLLGFQRRLLEENRLKIEDPKPFLLWCDRIALQRHLKCIGIFSRLYYRDKKSIYLQDIPRVLRYIKSVCQRHTLFEPLLGRFIR